MNKRHYEHTLPNIRGSLSNTYVIKGFNSKEGKPFSAAVAFDGDFNTVFVFPDVKNNRNSKRKKK